MAEAPKVRTNKVQGIMELDEDMQYMLPAAGDRDIDLSMLTAVLASAEQVNPHCLSIVALHSLCIWNG